MLCPNCTEEVRDTAKVCGYCGVSLPAVAGPEEVTAPVVSEAAMPGESVAEPSRSAGGPAGKPKLGSGLWLGLLAAVAVAIGVVAVAVALSGGDGIDDRAAATTTTTTTAQVVTTDSPTTTPPDLVREYLGVPIISLDEVPYDRLDLMPPQAAGGSGGPYTCEVSGTEELPDGPRDLLVCTGEVEVPQSDYHVRHGFERNDGQPLEDYMDEGNYFELVLDGVGRNPDGYLEWSGSDPTASAVHILSLRGPHTLVGIWYELGVPILTSVTEVVFP